MIAAAVFVLRGKQEHEHQAKNKPASMPVPATTAKARQGDLDVYLDALGTVTPVASVMVTSRVQGQITAVSFKEGQMVHKGDALVDIDPRPYQAAVLQAQGKLTHDQSVVKQAKINLARYKEAYAQKVVAKQQLDDQEQLVAQAEGSVTEDQGALQAAQVNLAFCHITSPIDGRVGLRQVDAGNMVDASATKALAVVTQLDPIDIVFSVAEDHLAAVQSELHAGHKLAVDVYDRSQQQKLASAQVLTLDNVVDPTTGTVKLKAEAANPNGVLFANQFVNIKLRIETQKAKTLVATPAIQRNMQGTFVYVVRADQTAEVRPVKPTGDDGTTTAVDGLKPGETVVVSGFDKLQDGIKIAAEAQPDAAAKGTAH